MKFLEEISDIIHGKLPNVDEGKKRFIVEYIASTKARSKNDITKAFRYANDDEWYTTKEDVQHFINKANISKDKVIWCPFDMPDSNFVSVFKKNGYKVISSHILEDKDFYKYTPKQKWDIIISNPPFRNKHKLLERLLEFNKPWALIFGIQALNSEKFCDMLQKFKRPQYIHLKRRMCFTKDYLNYDVLNLDRPSFASMWICNDLFEDDIQVWNGVNYKKDNKEYC
ncbi:sugar-phosphate nucleotidyltransferase [Mycoplasmopsis primatum]|uniref:sugar-phosphate nucleotidyltransferase n=1 Tax=Mycoplasmopsis primatum TaxID=55604 RepID=UPI000A88B661|nr:sugar-phosphate nucleotidyltransferase [Mycoplasmopsis primatum]